MKFDKKKSDAVAQGLLGMTFRMNGRGKDNTIDCYGVLVYYFESFGIKMPDYSSIDNWENRGEVYLREYATVTRKLRPDEIPEAGDVIFFIGLDNAPSHAAIYLGDNKFVHSYEKIGVKIDSVLRKPWKEHLYSYFRIKDEK